MSKKGESKYKQLNDKEWLYQKYWVEKLSLQKIANDFGCSVQAIVNGLNRNDIPTRDGNKRNKSKYPKLNDKKWLYNKYWVELLCLREITEKVGCGEGTGCLALKRHGIRRRNTSETRKGVSFSEDHKRKIGDALKGNINNKGNHHSDKTKKKIGEGNKGNKNWLGKQHSNETKIKMSIVQTKRRKAKGIMSITQRKINNSIRVRIRCALHGTKNGQHWETLVGYTLQDLIMVLEKEFRDGMCWENYGAFWHVDHIIPLAHFKYNSPEDPEFKKAWSLGNLQPLLASENLEKGTKFRFF